MSLQETTDSIINSNTCMKIEKTPLADVFVIDPKVYADERGYFFETYNEQSVKGTVLDGFNWVQENESKSTRGVLRGLHFQKGKYAQAKLVRAIVGEVFDVAVDMRADSPTLGQWYGIVLSGENKKQFLIPRGFAHGFLVLSEVAIFAYKCDNYYAPEHDSGLYYNDQEISINWPELNIEYVLSEKDRQLDSFAKAYKF